MTGHEESGHDMSDEGQRAQLADGRWGVVRSLRPNDRPGVTALFEQASEQNLYTRFFSLGGRVVARHLEHLFDESSSANSYVLTIGPRVVGVADVEPVGAVSSVASVDSCSEIAFFVADDLHGQGVATLLLEQAAHDADAHGVAWLVSDVLALNHPMMQVFTDAGYALECHRDGGEVSVRMSTASTQGSDAATAGRRASADRRSGQVPTRPI